jgi:hypothetical protein
MGGMKRVIGKPVLSDKLDAELGAKVVELFVRDMERAERERAEKRTKEPKRRKKGTRR